MPPSLRKPPLAHTLSLRNPTRSGMLPLHNLAVGMAEIYDRQAQSILLHCNRLSPPFPKFSHPLFARPPTSHIQKIHIGSGYRPIAFPDHKTPDPLFHLLAPRESVLCPPPQTPAAGDGCFPRSSRAIPSPDALLVPDNGHPPSLLFPPDSAPSEAAPCRLSPDNRQRPSPPLSLREGPLPHPRSQHGRLYSLPPRHAPKPYLTRPPHTFAGSPYSSPKVSTVTLLIFCTFNGRSL